MSDKRVLIIEDRPKMLEMGRRIIEDEDHEVDVATNKNEALILVNLKTYHVAIVDIMLAGEDVRHDRGGIDVIRRIKELDEGTETIVWTATKDFDVAVETLGNMKVFALIKKENLERAANLLTPLNNALEQCELKLYGPHERLLEYLSYPESTDFWSGKVLQHIRAGGHDVFDRFMENLLKKMLPVLRPKDEKPFFTLDSTNKTLTAICWSKAIGEAVLVFVSPVHPVELLPQKKESLGDLIDDIKVKALRGRIWILPGLDREMFWDTLYQIHKSI